MQRADFMSPRAVTPDAEHYTATLPILTLVDSELLNRSMQRSLKGVTLPPTYKAMCCQCGEIVQHRLDREQDQTRPCGNGHLVAPTIARGMLIPPRPAAPATDGTGHAPKPAPRPVSRRAIKAHNRRLHARMMRKPRGV